MKSKFMLLLATLAFALSGCGGGGVTDAGNPAPQPWANNCLNSMCSKLHECFPSLSLAQCAAGIKASSSIDTELGVRQGIGTFQDLMDAESAGQITAYSPAKSTCTRDIGLLACDSTEVQAAFNTGNPSDFENVNSLLSRSSLSCAGAYLGSSL
jgi:hypothetical protein